ncbi:MAG TPA: pyridoxamine 5'-phosphate oxidase family protein [Acidimicrobiia bacterium]|nr:pyridoxamine 5'-phosphate oxidase family protein [Acidimicrobiia bacterium]
MTERPHDHAGMEILGHAECLRLIWSHAIGRIGFVDKGEPQILPVQYRLHDNRIVFQSAVGAKLDAAIFRAPVVFEIDGSDESRASGWSVVVHGTARQVEGEDDLTALEALGMEPWVHGPQPMRWIEIVPNEITGRRIPGSTPADPS